MSDAPSDVPGPEPATSVPPAARRMPRALALLVSAFWNRDERRLRALWRLLGFVLIVSGVSAGLRATGWFPERGTPVYDLVVTPTRLAVAVVGVWLAGRLLDRRPFRDFGMALDRSWLADLAFGLVLGALLMGGIFLVQWSLGWAEVSGAWRTAVDGVPFAQAFLTPLVAFVCVGILEELIARGYLLRNTAEGLAFPGLGGARGGLIAAVLITSVLFALGHVNNPNATWVSTVNIGFAGVFLALGLLFTGQLALPVGLHITWNLFQASVFGFPVSGVTRMRTSILATEETGPDLWTGGVFGPEAGLLSLVAMLVGIGLTLAWVRWRRGEVRLVTAFAEPPRRSGALFA